MPSPGGDLGQVVTLVVGDLVANQPERYGHTCRSDPIPDLLLDEGGVLIAGIGPVPGDHDDAVDLLGALRERLGEVLHGLGDAPQQGSFAACPDFAGGLGDLLAVVGAKVHELGGVVLGAALTAEAAQPKASRSPEFSTTVLRDFTMVSGPSETLPAVVSMRNWSCRLARTAVAPKRRRSSHPRPAVWR